MIATSFGFFFDAADEKQRQCDTLSNGSTSLISFDQRQSTMIQVCDRVYRAVYGLHNFENETFTASSF